MSAAAAADDEPVVDFNETLRRAVELKARRLAETRAEYEAAPRFVKDTLTTDRDFTAFKGFPVTATTSEPYKSKTSWEGTLVKRDDEFLTLNLKGRPVKIPIGLVVDVKLPSAKREAGDTFGT